MASTPTTPTTTFQTRANDRRRTDATHETRLLNKLEALRASEGFTGGSNNLMAAGLLDFLGVKPGEPLKPFPAQIEILQTVQIPWPGIMPNGDPYPLIFGINCGRRFSKTTIGELLLWQGLIAPDDQFGPPTVRLTADTEEHGQKIWRKFLWHLDNTRLKALKQDHVKEFNLVTLKTGATAQLLSANNPAALSGDGVSLWVIDESQFLTQAAFDNLLPSTAERSGVVVALGVSEGSGPFRELCFKGDSPDYPEFLRLAYPTASNPLVPRWMIDFAARTLSPTKFKQLYLAQWESELGAVFRNVDGCTNQDPIYVDPTGYGFTQPPLAGHDYYCGLDLGRLTDWTVFTIWDRFGRLVAWDRFSLISWELQKARVASLSAVYGHPTTIVDSTGVGDPVPEDLTRLGMNVEPYQIGSNLKKQILIDELSIRIGAGQISYPRIPIFLEELRRFEAKRNKDGAGPVRYEAPAGTHDDFVLSAALAMQSVPRRASIVIPSELEDLDEASARQVAPWEAIS